VAGAARKVQNGQWGNTSTKGAGKMGKSKMSKRNQLTMFEVRGGHEAAVLRPTGQGAAAGESAGGGGGKRAKTLSLADRLASGAGGREAEVAFSLFPAYHCFCCSPPSVAGASCFFCALGSSLACATCCFLPSVPRALT
jgi:hypothetical protein